MMALHPDHWVRESNVVEVVHVARLRRRPVDFAYGHTYVIILKKNKMNTHETLMDYYLDLYFFKLIHYPAVKKSTRKMLLKIQLRSNVNLSFGDF